LWGIDFVYFGWLKTDTITYMAVINRRSQMCERIKCVKRFVIAFLKSAVINHRTRNVRINLTGEVVCNRFFITFYYGGWKPAYIYLTVVLKTALVRR